MKISHSFTANITKDTYVSSYSNGNNQSCSFFADGETVTINFNADCLHQVRETIKVLQQIDQSLSEQRQQQIANELEQLNTHHFMSLSQSHNGKYHTMEITS
ncbi:hypothetical protein H6G54_29040 [Anabaena cylindrica FACHB-243]|nr:MULTISPECIES: hypothetical protein [Anabaena]MBD2421652.1 hypothetical protein [Anabaena cylindrica FACHB-243]MBY5280449.1 hypothetical protein [Anabaena sp. CCAP 1446/1C]MBY5308180.1 hypothetical protein [Anabaena sp. CCAP 1446/1C]MCM2405446.1 hypothetical protein [Anabaena sp. CCAP 1446/1C]